MSTAHRNAPKGTRTGPTMPSDASPSHQTAAPVEGPRLKLAPIYKEVDSYKLEKRIARRYSTSGRVTAVARESHPDGDRNRILSLQLLNMSESGMAAMCQEPLPADTQVTVFIPPHGAEQGTDMFGRVVRCNARDWGYDVGVPLNTAVAAA